MADGTAKVFTCGGVRVTHPTRGDAKPSRPQSRRLLAFLASHKGQDLTKAEVAKELWGNDHSIRNLLRGLDLLRDDLGAFAGLIDASRSGLVRFEESVAADIVEFRTQMEAAQKRPSVGALENALAALDGGYLSCLDDKLGPWVTSEKRRHALDLAEVHLQLGALHLEGGSLRPAAHEARSAVSAASDSERVLREAMRLMVDAGATEEAKAALDQFEVAQKVTVASITRAALKPRKSIAFEGRPRFFAPQSPPMALSVDRLASVSRTEEWIVGAHNHDEDLHFSSFYTRQSCRAYASEGLGEYSYERLLAVYDNFNETYYIPRAECVRVAERLLAQVRASPAWLQDILDEISHRLGHLGRVFEFPDGHPPEFSDTTSSDLLKLYQSHNRAHGALYEVARIPEALDRGVATFRTYLTEYLRNRGPALQRPVDRHQVFDVLTFPEGPSRAVEEHFSLVQLARDLLADPAADRIFAGSAKRAQLRMNPRLMKQLQRHRDTWAYWGYHGYGSRALPDANWFLARIGTMVASADAKPPLDEAAYTARLADAEEERLRAFNRYGIDENHQMLFRLYSRVGLVKLNRRFAQLRNFVALDRLIVEIADRLQVAEGAIRSCLPEEVEAALSGDDLPADLEDRMELVVHLIDGDAEYLATGEGPRHVAEELERSTRRTTPSTGEKLSGEVIFPGAARGRAKVVIRHLDAERNGFRAGDILISESTDSDLMDFMEIAGGIITQEGGSTCHAAIYCRELEKPSLMGVDGLLRVVRNDDFIVLQADEGYFRILSLEREFTIDDVAVKAEPGVAAKAQVLGRLLEAGVRVPRFFAVRWRSVVETLLEPPADAIAETASDLLAEVEEALRYLDGDLFILRSSMSDEDGAEGSGAGRWESVSGVERDDVLPAIRAHAEDLARLGARDLGGSIIVQEMVLGDISGVTFTRDDSSRNQMVIEAVPGGNEPLTSGVVTPARYELSETAGRINVHIAREEWRHLLSRGQLEELWHEFRRIETLRGVPQNIEWTLKNGHLWILQSRPIAAPGVIADPRHRRRTEPAALSAVSVYQAYRVPSELRRHLLRVAGVGLWILDRWIGPPLDRENVLVTLLLHDIGNIVKADFDKHPELSPVSSRDKQYWEAVQSQMRERHGTSDHSATESIARELGLGSRIFELLEGKKFTANIETAASDDWERMICAYADQRVAPFGVVSLRERLEEAKRRYDGLPQASVNDRRWPQLVEAALAIEGKLSPLVSEALTDIDDAAVATSLDKLKGYEISRLAA